MTEKVVWPVVKVHAIETGDTEARSCDLALAAILSGSQSDEVQVAAIVRHKRILHDYCTLVGAPSMSQTR